jgi:hypothetical protein
MRDLELGDPPIKYRINSMKVFDQAHVARKVMPIVFRMGASMAGATAKTDGAPNGVATTNGHDEQSVAEQNEIIFDAMLPVADIIAKMSEEDFNYVLNKCLSACERYNGATYVPLMRSNQLMFELELTAMLRLTVEVVTDNLSPTLIGLLGRGLAGEGDLLPR